MKNKKLIFSLVAVIVIVLLSVFFINKNGDYETIEVSRGNFIEVVEISGKVVPSQDIDLSFELVGKVSRVNVRSGDIVSRGDILVELDSSEIDSELSEVYFNLEKERALLSEASDGSDIQSRVENESQNLISTIKKAYVTSDDIVKNIVDTFFDDPNNRIPDFTSALGDYFLRKEINETRREVGDLLIEWKSNIDNLNNLNLSNADALSAIDNLKTLESFLAIISSDVDKYNPISSLSQSQIDAYITNISNARKTVASLIVEINTVYDSYRDILADIPVLESSVGNAEASVQKISARKNKYVLRAPFDGIVTDTDVESGQVVSAGERVLTMITDNSFEIEGYIPELNILGVDVGDIATLTFDAFGDDLVFNATVSHVDPSETIKDGITTYKVLLSFDDVNANIRSGMTNDIEIIKDQISSRIVIPLHLVSDDEEGDYVEVLESGEVVKKYISISRKDGKGGVLIESGLEGGEFLIKE